MMEIKEPSPGHSFVHTMDPRSKILAAAVFSTAVALNPSLTAAVAALVFPIILIVGARPRLTGTLKRLAAVNAFVLFLWCLVPFTSGGDVIWNAGPLKVYWQGVDQALLITVKSNAIVLMVMALLGTSSIFTLVHALSHMGVPNKLVHLFFFSYRYVHVIAEEYSRLHRAMKIRGFRPRTDLHTYRSYAYLVGMLLVRSFDRSRRIMAAMRCRGFARKFYILHHYEMKKCDYALAASSFLFCAVMLVLR